MFLKRWREEQEGEESNGEEKRRNKEADDFSLTPHSLQLELPQVCVCALSIQRRLKEHTNNLFLSLCP